jgi:8-oxo-dGTP pyrophosphatase MutT (NUDIX family)
VAPVVRAAGGVVWRMGETGLDILLVHRPRYQDWTFPKGKADLGELDEHCALREVHEETGHRCALGRELPSIEYRDAKDRPKKVRYWEMRVIADDGFSPNAEIDALAWTSLAEVAERLTYRHDREVLDAFAAFAGGATAAEG